MCVCVHMVPRVLLIYFLIFERVVYLVCQLYYYLVCWTTGQTHVRHLCHVRLIPICGLYISLSGPI